MRCKVTPSEAEVECMKILRVDRLQGFISWGRGVMKVVQSLGRGDFWVAGRGRVVLVEVVEDELVIVEIDADKAVRSLEDAVDQGLKRDPVNSAIWHRDDLEIP